jgi:hypothetical protein
VAFALWLKIFIGESSLVLTCLLFDLFVIFLWMPLEEYKMLYFQKKEFGELDDYRLLTESSASHLGDSSAIM